MEQQIGQVELFKTALKTVSSVMRLAENSESAGAQLVDDNRADENDRLLPATDESELIQMQQ